MSTMFERFVKMAKEEFGYTVIHDDSTKLTTFESLFGVSTEDIARYELPYNVSAEQFAYYDEPLVSDMFGVTFTANSFNFDIEEYCNFAA